MIDMLEKGGIPLPDRVAPGNAKVSETKLDLNYSGLTFYKDAAGDYHCHCEEKARDFSFTIKLKPLKKVILHGHDGTVKIGRKGDDMFYYFIPRCETTGSVSVAGKTYPVSGTGWYDHEFGGQIRAAKPTDSKEPQEPKTHRTDYGWNWLAVQLEDGTDISATTVVNPDNNYKVLDNYAIIIGPNSERTFYKDTVELRAVSEWVSCRSAADLPDRWVLNVPDAGIHLEVAAVFRMQECMTVIAKPSFFEGRCEVVGTIKGVQVKGTAFLERAGFGQSGSMDGFFSQVSKLTKKEVARMLPLDINDDQMRDLMADKGMEHYMDGADRTIFMENVIKPIREYVDRGGKSWR
jgi:predicted secreted hydrolase